MRTIELYPQSEELTLTPEQDAKLKEWIFQELVYAKGARTIQEFLWRELLRLYEAVPKNPIRNVPIENAPNIEVTLGAIASDSVYAQMLDLIFSVSPLITARPQDKRWTTHAKAIQRWANFRSAQPSTNLRASTENTLLDNVQLGTGVFYIPFREHVKKTHSYTVKERGPAIVSVPIEDILTPGGAYDDIQRMKWFAMRSWPTKQELEMYAKYRGWNIENVVTAGIKDWVRLRRESLGRSISQINTVTNIYEVYDIYAYMDIDDDGHDEDLLIHYDYTSQSILKCRYNPYDRRPFRYMNYQRRPHLFNGIGVMEMLKPYEEELTELHNHQLVNVMLANCRLWKSRTGTIPDGTLTIWPNRNVELSNPEDLQGEQLADIYQSLPQTQAMVISLAERRVGLNDMNSPRPSQVLGSRTPGITALSMLQQVNRRFTPAFDSARMAVSGAVEECLYRDQELIRDGDEELFVYMAKVLGDEDAMLIRELMADDDFQEAVAIELTASSAMVNRESERQNSVMLVNLLGSYYEKTLQLVAIAANPQTPEPVREVARKIAAAAGEIIERTIRTFDQVRDPATFIIEVETELDQIQAAPEGLQALQAMLGTALQGAGNGAGLPPGMA